MIELTRINEDGEMLIRVDVLDIHSFQIYNSICTLNLINGDRFSIKESQEELERKIREEIRGNQIE